MFLIYTKTRNGKIDKRVLVSETEKRDRHLIRLSELYPFPDFTVGWVEITLSERGDRIIRGQEHDIAGITQA